MGVLYERINDLCVKNGITGYRLCKDIGISPNTMTELRKGRRDGVSAENAAKIASYFGVTVEYLMYGKEKTATSEGDGLSETQRALIEKVKRMTEDQAAAFLASASLLEDPRKGQDSE